MKTIKTVGFQGDVCFRRVKSVPDGFSEKAHDGTIVAAHSETGHHHTIDATGVKLFEGNDPLRCYLMMESVEHCDVVHRRSFDTHETMRLGGGIGSIFEVVRQREYTPEGWRRAAD